MDYFAERIKKITGHVEVWEIYRRHALYEIALRRSGTENHAMKIGSALGRAGMFIHELGGFEEGGLE